jgi:hypothetical protein
MIEVYRNGKDGIIEYAVFSKNCSYRINSKKELISITTSEQKNFIVKSWLKVILSEHREIIVSYLQKTLDYE